MSHPSYEDFYAALADPSRRPVIGLVISDDDAWSLLENDEWARDYYAEWLALAPTDRSTDAAPPAPPEPVPAEPATPVLLVEPTPAPAAVPARSGLPRWATAAIVVGAAVVLLGAVGVGALVYTGVTAAGAGNGTADTTTPGPTAGAGADGGDEPLPWEEDYVAPYSEAHAAKYLAIVGPLFESAAGAGASGSDLDESYLLFGSSACVSLDAGFAEADVVDPIVQASAGTLRAAEGQTMIDAAKKYLCE